MQKARSLHTPVKSLAESKQQYQIRHVVLSKLPTVLLFLFLLSVGYVYMSQISRLLCAVMNANFCFIIWQSSGSYVLLEFGHIASATANTTKQSAHTYTMTSTFIVHSKDNHNLKPFIFLTFEI